MSRQTGPRETDGEAGEARHDRRSECVPSARDEQPPPEEHRRELEHSRDADDRPRRPVVAALEEKPAADDGDRHERADVARPGRDRERDEEHEHAERRRSTSPPEEPPKESEEAHHPRGPPGDDDRLERQERRDRPPQDADERWVEIRRLEPEEQREDVPVARAVRVEEVPDVQPLTGRVVVRRVEDERHRILRPRAGADDDPRDREHERDRGRHPQAQVGTPRREHPQAGHGPPSATARPRIAVRIPARNLRHARHSREGVPGLP